MQTFQGLAVSDGLTVGPVVRIDRGAAGLHRIAVSYTHLTLPPIA